MKLSGALMGCLFILCQGNPARYTTLKLAHSSLITVSIMSKSIAPLRTLMRNCHISQRTGNDLAMKL